MLVKCFEVFLTNLRLYTYDNLMDGPCKVKYLLTYI